jgi:hypothetical protein
MAAEGTGPLLHARVGMLRAINAGKPIAATIPRRKRTRHTAVFDDPPRLCGGRSAFNGVQWETTRPLGSAMPVYFIG